MVGIYKHRFLKHHASPSHVRNTMFNKDFKVMKLEFILSSSNPSNSNTYSARYCLVCSSKYSSALSQTTLVSSEGNAIESQSESSTPRAVRIFLL
mmetsp:Transcript_11554/g.24720  ORF Transcript_11554/g.24720 Transcript_11554/m.24720 type:complete len:95 (+) Transcript_11554:198-482(+)